MSELSAKVPRDLIPLVVELVDRLNRQRDLRADETALLIRMHRLTATPVSYRRWTREEDRSLLAAAKHRGRLPIAFAQLGITTSAGYSRLRFLKRKGGR